ncbi:site-specific DNA-methyltransferase [Rathayibacter sp. AY2B7]|uniref:DNA-methyltransferase n=1 Tax=Rathayibacter sp. AY2B7 TaxID=2080571 RepID=UPI000CE86C2D|nr:site-specific DNA-methyltransferase [Rathayibacter sp. AY2B7]PPG59650.1 site-specific DNA-methyltransferase [Rathayibacter sp. AY2B7]
MANSLPDIKPRTAVASLDRAAWAGATGTFRAADVAPVVGMSVSFVRKVVGHAGALSTDDVILILDQDAFRETFVPRSRVLPYLVSASQADEKPEVQEIEGGHLLMEGHVLDQIRSVAPASVQCVVTSTPYWGMRIYKDSLQVDWADGETCAYGHEQTPDGFVRHTAQILHELRHVLTGDASLWWNLMDSYNTRTQIRGNAAEALRAMQGKDDRAWADHEARRYSAGHSYLKDGEQCMIPMQVAERASRLGYFVKSVITWAKTSSLPEPQNSRVSRGLEYVLHLTTGRTPKFDKTAYRRVAPALGGRNVGWESDKLSDVWVLPTSAGRGLHGAQFPTALPGRCIALSTDVNDVVLDPFVGSGTAGVAARALGRRFIGIDISPTYLAAAEEAISSVPASGFATTAIPNAVQALPMTGAL